MGETVNIPACISKRNNLSIGRRFLSPGILIRAAVPIAFVIILAACGGAQTATPAAETQPADLSGTQAALSATATQSRQITLAALGTATQAAAPRPANTDPYVVVDSPSDVDYVDDPPTPTPKYGPDVVTFTAGEEMFCRDAPSGTAEAHYTMPATESWPVLGRWPGDAWLLLSIDTSETRTKCCWVGGQGSLNVPLESLPVIDYTPDRIKCELN